MTSDADYADVLQSTVEWVFQPMLERRTEFPEKVDGFCALRRCRYRGELMVIGRACKGFEELPRGLPDGADWEGLAHRPTRWPMSQPNPCGRRISSTSSGVRISSLRTEVQTSRLSPHLLVRPAAVAQFWMLPHTVRRSARSAPVRDPGAAP